uniref:CXXC-type domain-containing protein n=1 Tax=Macrostomum lignano TaxID=282301 RepID=A0A1I8F8C4_9PLAT
PVLADSLVSSLRRQAQQEARAAVAAAEARAEQLLAAERLRSQRMAARIREEALAASRVQVGSAETCWNCGRIASETCSGCSAARYCGQLLPAPGLGPAQGHMRNSGQQESPIEDDSEGDRAPSLRPQDQGKRTAAGPPLTCSDLLAFISPEQE